MIAADAITHGAGVLNGRGAMVGDQIAIIGGKPAVRVARLRRHRHTGHHLLHLFADLPHDRSTVLAAQHHDDSAHNLAASVARHGTLSDLRPVPHLRHVTQQDGKAIEFTTTCRIDTPVEIEYYRNGGILQTVLRKILKGA